MTPPIAPSADNRLGKPLQGWRLKLYTIIFEADTRAGAAVRPLADRSDPGQRGGGHGSTACPHQCTLSRGVLTGLEWVFTLLFTLEYLARLACVRHRYALRAQLLRHRGSAVACLPTYLALLVPGTHVLVDVRVLRLLRMFRVFKLTAYVSEYQTLGSALVASRRKIMVFLSVVMMIVLIMGTLMYLVEGPANGFTSIPTAVYWAITTMTTVGFGDITPKTDTGRLIASLMMLLGWGTLAVPTGIVTSEMTAQRRTASHHHTHLPRVPDRRPCAGGAALPALRCKAAHLPARRLIRQSGSAGPR